MKLINKTKLLILSCLCALIFSLNMRIDPAKKAFAETESESEAPVVQENSPKQAFKAFLETELEGPGKKGKRRNKTKNSTKKAFAETETELEGPGKKGKRRNKTKNSTKKAFAETETESEGPGKKGKKRNKTKNSTKKAFAETETESEKPGKKGKKRNKTKNSTKKAFAETESNDFLDLSCGKKIEADCSKDNHCQWDAKNKACNVREVKKVTVVVCGTQSQSSCDRMKQLCYWDATKKACKQKGT